MHASVLKSWHYVSGRGHVHIIMYVTIYLTRFPQNCYNYGMPGSTIHVAIDTVALSPGPGPDDVAVVGVAWPLPSGLASGPLRTLMPD